MIKFKVVTCPIYALAVETILDKMNQPELELHLVSCESCTAVGWACQGVRVSKSDAELTEGNSYWVCNMQKDGFDKCSKLPCSIPMADQELLAHWCKEGYMVLTSSWVQYFSATDRLEVMQKCFSQNPRTILLDLGDYQDSKFLEAQWLGGASTEIIRLPLGHDLLYARIDSAFSHYKNRMLEKCNDIGYESLENADSEKATALLSQLTHDLLNPINSISGALQLIAFTSLDDEQKELVEIAKDAVALYLEYVSQRKDLYELKMKRELSRSQTFSLRIMLEELISANLNYDSGEPASIVLSMEDDVRPFYQGDQGSLLQILSCLLTSALSHSRDKKISLRCFVLDRYPQDIDLLEIRIDVPDALKSTETLLEAFRRDGHHAAYSSHASNLDKEIFENAYESLAEAKGTLDIFSTLDNLLRYRMTCQLNRVTQL